MSFAILLAHHVTAPAVSTGFALLLVATLVAVEERDLRRGRAGVEAPRRA